MRSRVGFTLIEVIIATFIFAIGVLALEATAVGALREMRRSSRITLAASLARSRLEKLAATRCDALRDGSDTVDGIVSTWRTGGGATARVVEQTVAYEVHGRPRVDTYRSAVGCR